MFDSALLNGLLGTYTKEDLDSYIGVGFITQTAYDEALKRITQSNTATIQPNQSNVTNQ